MSAEPPPAPPPDPPLLPPVGGPPPPPKSSLGQFWLGVAITLVAVGWSFAFRTWAFSVPGLLILGGILVGFRRTRGYGFGILIGFGVSALVAFCICGFMFFHALK